ncbi:MAG: IPT/TIG domain-containing protein, partial [Acidobacteria bacterium]|nr:IPT/TIG domain-containing protein [Acidobacteriota bacterium]
MKSLRSILWLLFFPLAMVASGYASEGHSSSVGIGPIIKSLSPARVNAGSPGFTLIVRGRHFGKESVVLCDGGALPTGWGSSHELRAEMPASDLVKPGSLTITVQNRGRLSNPRYFNVTGPAPPGTQPVKITTTSLPGGQLGKAYGASLAATGGQQPYHWSLTSGSLPGGVSLSDSGQISGLPTAGGNFPVTVHVQDSSPQSSLQSLLSSGDSKALTISVAVPPPSPSPLLITTPSLPGGQQGSAYPTTALTAVGGTPPYHWSVSSGAL